MRHHAHLSATGLAHNPLGAVLSNCLIVRHVVDQHASSSVAVRLSDRSASAALFRRSTGDNLLKLASSIGQVDSSRPTGDQVPQLLADKDLDLLRNVRSRVDLQLHSQRKSSDYSNRRRTASAHILDSVPAIFGATDLIVLLLMRELQLVEDLEATRLVADRCEHHDFFE